MENNEYKYLGTMNGWKETPAEFVKHVESDKVKAHAVSIRVLGHCWHEYVCHDCKIRYRVDSSD